MPSSEQTPLVSRRTGLIGVRGVPANDLEQILAAIALDPTRETVVVDLALGAWRTHEAARQACDQLGLTPDLGPPSPMITRGQSAYADFIGWSIDRETGDQSTTGVALRLARQVATSALALPDGARFLILAPRFGLPWEPGDRAFVRFLADAAGGAPGKLECVVGVAGDGALPVDMDVHWTGRDQPRGLLRSSPSRIAGLVPGVIPPGLASAILGDGASSAMRLRDGSRMVPPEWRREPGASSALDFDAFAALPGLPAWLCAYGQAHGNNLFVDPLLLWSESLQRLAEGDTSIASRLLSRASAAAIGTDLEGRVASLAQGVLIASRRFREAAAAPDPRAGLPGNVRAFLLHAKGWGLVMSGNPAAADGYFQQVLDLLQGEGSRLDTLYLLNIWALARFRMEDLARALELEREIRDEHARLPARDWRLHYVNSMNLARIQRRSGAWGEAERSYTEAFATVRGAASVGDCVYANMCFSRTAADQGDRFGALLALIRAGLHWASGELPEAIGPRVTGAILEGPPPSEHLLVDAVSRKLADSILEAAAAAGRSDMLSSSADVRHAPAIIRIPDGGHPIVAGSTAVLGIGWSALVSSDPAPEPIDSDEHRRLRAVILAALVATAPPGSIDAPGTIGISDDCGRGIPVTARRLFELGLRLRPRRVLLRTFDVNPGACAATYEPRLLASVGNAVSEVNTRPGEANCTFKRYLDDCDLDADEAAILGQVADRPSVARLASRLSRDVPALLPVLRSLEQRRVLDLSLPSRSGQRGSGASLRSRDLPIR